MIELGQIILEAPMELRILLVSGLVIVLYQFFKEEIWGKQNQNDHQSKRY